MATQSSISSQRHALADTTHKQFFVMSSVGSYCWSIWRRNDASDRHRKTTHSEPGYSLCKSETEEHTADGTSGLGSRWIKRGIAPGVTGSLATGATYFGVIQSTKKWIEESDPSLEGHWAHFIAGAVGDTLGSLVYVPCEVMKQRMQVQGTMASWSSVVMKDNIAMKPGIQMYGYHTGMFHAGCSIWEEQGQRGLYAGYWSTLARDVPFAGLMVMFYEGLKDLTDYGKQKYIRDPNFHVNSSVEGLVLGGLAGGWLDAIRRVWRAEGAAGMFRGSIPRITWDIPASALTFMAVEFLREHFNEGLSNGNTREVASMSVEKKGSPLQGAA